MNFDFATLDLLRQSHPAWRLLRSDHAPLVASFLQRLGEMVGRQLEYRPQGRPRKAEDGK
jgi:hypothetical protein